MDSTLINQVPEVGDGGYWYAFPAEQVADETGATALGYPGIPSGCAWYADISGTVMVAVRTPEPVAGIAAQSIATVAGVLAAAGYTGKPFGRVSGL